MESITDLVPSRNQPYPRHTLASVCVLLIALCGWIYRDTWLPLWARPEAYRLVAGRLQRVDRPGSYLVGYPHLLFGDSQVGACPWTADLLYFPVATPEQIVTTMDYYCGDWQYEQVVVWWGTGHFALGNDVQQYVTTMKAVVEAAHRRSDNVYVVGPLPVHYIDGSGRLSTQRIVTEAVTALRTALPNTPIYDMTEWKGEIDVHGGPRVMMLPDSVHISGSGFDVLGSHLAELGFQVPPPRNGG